MSTALVTGATVGIGLSFARTLAQGRHDLVLVARDGARLEAVAADLRQRFGVAVEVLVADLADRGQVETVARRVADEGRPVDVVVNNAGFGLGTEFLDADIADEERLLAVLCQAVLVISQAAGRAMSARGRGRIVNISSVASFAPGGTYYAAKAWVTSFTEGLSNELSGSGVTATAVCPGFTRTEFHQRGGMGMSKLPEWMWLAADDVARQGWADALRGKVISVPGWQYKALVGLLRTSPRPLVRRVTAGIGRRRHGR